VHFEYKTIIHIFNGRKLRVSRKKACTGNFLGSRTITIRVHTIHGSTYLSDPVSFFPAKIQNPKIQKQPSVYKHENQFYTGQQSHILI